MHFSDLKQGDLVSWICFPGSERSVRVYGLVLGEPTEYQATDDDDWTLGQCVKVYIFCPPDIWRLLVWKEDEDQLTQRSYENWQNDKERFKLFVIRP